MSRVFPLLAALLWLTSAAWAQAPRIAWDPNPPEENVTGYLVYWGAASRYSDGWTAYENELDVGNVTESPPITVPDDRFTWFAVKAYNAAGLRSDYSAEVYVSPLASPPPVDCEVGAWSAWGACSETCGGGTQTRTRAILTPPANGGAACPALSEAQACNTQPCEGEPSVDCVVDVWSAWGACSAPCGGGTQTRTRSVLTPAANGGAACPTLGETQACNTQDCPPPAVPAPAKQLIRVPPPARPSAVSPPKKLYPVPGPRKRYRR